MPALTSNVETGAPDMSTIFNSATLAGPEWSRKSAPNPPRQAHRSIPEIAFVPPHNPGYIRRK